jgi:hypothetical protein
MKHTHKRPTNPCPACCYAPDVPALKSPALRALVARLRALEIANRAGQPIPTSQAGGYVVCIDGQPVGRIGHPSQVTCHYPAPGEFDWEPDLPVSGVAGEIIRIEAEVKAILRTALGEAGAKFTAEDFRQRGIDKFPEVL